MQALSLPDGDTTVADSGAGPGLSAPEASLALIDLHLDLAQLRRLTLQESQDQHWVDAYLLAVGAGQVVEDHLQGVGSLMRRAARHYRSAPNATARVTGRILGAAAPFVQRAPGGRSRSGALNEASRRLAGLVEDLCAAAFGPSVPGRRQAAALVAASAAAFEGFDDLPVWNDILRLPSCFRSFDQRPEDMAALVEGFAARQPNRARPMMVIGVRTSGSYLAPICAQYLGALGYGDVRCATVRPGYPLRQSVWEATTDVALAGGTTLVVDDPPVSGRSVLEVAQSLMRTGIAPGSIVTLRPRVKDDGLPDALAGMVCVDLPPERWQIVRLLRTEAIADALGALMPAGNLRRVEPADPMPAPHRGHLRRRFNIEWAPAPKRPVTHDVIVAESTGFGFFGRHALAVARSIPELTAPIIGWHNGLLLRRWLPDTWRMADTAAALPVASHIASRHRALRVDHDRSMALRGRQTAWEVASEAVGKSLGRFGTILRPVLVDPVVREVLEVAEPSVVDGVVDPKNWFIPDAGGVALKVDVAEGAFSHLDLSSYDPVFDLAGVATASGNPRFARALLDAYETAVGSAPEPERWALLNLVHLWNTERLGVHDHDWVRRASARVLQRYFASRFLDDLPNDATGPWCALDLDGVLESSRLGFSATSHLGALGLRALRAHGYRPLIATGRSLGEVIERCEAFGLDGGVAEYGAAVYDARARAAITLTPDEGVARLAKLRQHLWDHRVLAIDPDFAHILRVYIPGPGGRRSCPRAGTVEAFFGERPEAFVAIPGDDQLDVIPAGVDKGRGLDHLLGRIDGISRRHTPLVMAIGDGVADLPMLALAELRLAPAHARTQLVHHGIEVTAGAYQAGFFDAVSRLIGHQPGNCPRCRAPEMPRTARRLLALLSVQEAGTRGAPLRLARLVLGTPGSKGNR